MRLLSKILAMVTMGFSICFLLHPVYASAQNNPYKINDRLYEIYQRGFNNANNVKSLATADTLFSYAAHMNEPKAQCMALAIKLIHFYNVKDQENLLLAVNRLKDFSKHVGLMQYYYFAIGNYINFLSDSNLSNALDYANDMRKEAERRNDRIGIYSTMRAISNIYFTRLEFSTAKQQYLETINYGNKYLENENSALQYARLAQCCIELEQFKEAEKYATIGIQQSKVKSTREFNDLILCLCKFFNGTKEDFQAHFLRVRKTFNDHNTAIRKIVPELYILYYISNKDFDTALTEMEKNGCRSFIYSIFYKEQGDYKKALEYREHIYNKNYLLRKSIRTQEIVKQETKITNFLLRESSRQAKLENALLVTDNNNLELEQINATSATKQAEARHDSLEIRSKALENNHMRTIMEKNRIANIKSAKEAHDSAVRMRISVAAITTLLIIVLLIIIYRAYMTRKLGKINLTLNSQHEALTKASEYAEEADRIKTLFMQNMSHEVRTPLNAIVGFSQLLADDGEGLSDEEKADFANRIEENSDIVQNIINSILDLTSIESGHYKMQPSATPVNEMCHDAINEVTHSVHCGVSLEFETAVADDFSIITDRRRLDEVLTNLLTNAIKNTEHGSITLNCHIDNDDAEGRQSITFAVTDTGVGIPADKANAIFDRFYKIDDFKQGVGLGLTICRAIATMLHGTIAVDTAHHPGSRITFTIPVKPV